MALPSSLISTLSQDAPVQRCSQKTTAEYRCSLRYDGDYLSNDDRNIVGRAMFSAESKLAAKDREQIVDWCYGVVDVLQLARSNVAVAMSIANRFMSNPNRLLVRHFTHHLFSPQEIMYDRTMFQLLLAVSALYIAIKINEQVIFSVEKFAEASRGSMYTVEDIEAMERAILECLSWKVSTPTALEVGYTILELITHQVQDISELNNELMGSIVEDLAFQTESAVRDYHLITTQRTSTIAIMALINAIKHNEQMSKTVRQHYLNALLMFWNNAKREIFRSEPGL